MIKVNIDAAIEPQKSAAGFALGLELTKFYDELNLTEVKKWSKEGGIPLYISIQQSDDWLCVPVREISEGRFDGEIWYYSKGMVELHFNQLGQLFNISVFDGYQGKLINSIYIGMLFSDLQKFCNLIFDEAEEIYISENNDNLIGVSFYIDESVDTPFVHGISISDITIKNI